jgi:hypothetical protein
MKTITIQIGNSDDKLSQKEWSEYISAVNMEINNSTEYTNIHFFGASASWESWQNACWVFEIEEFLAFNLRNNLIKIRELYKQNSIAWTEGDTSFI